MGLNCLGIQGCIQWQNLHIRTRVQTDRREDEQDSAADGEQAEADGMRSVQYRL